MEGSCKCAKCPSECTTDAKCACSACPANCNAKNASKPCCKIDPKTFGVKKVAIIGSGNWGSTLAKLVGVNAQRLPYIDPEVRMWVFEETLPDGRKLTEVINTDHENVKYLSGILLPPNLVAVPDVLKTVENADYLLFVIPHQFLRGVCNQLKGKIKPGALAISAIKGFDVKPDGKVQLVSELITSLLGIDVAVLMGANLARPIALEEFSETTIGVHSEEEAHVLKELFQTDYFRVETVRDASTVEICGALKNIVALGAGFCDGLSLGDNTKAAVIRIGLIEMVKFANEFYPGGQMRTFFESCGIADLVTTCYGGRNRQVAAAVAKTGKSFEQLEAELLGGQRLQGPATAEEVQHLLKSKGVEDKFPLFVAVYRACKGEIQPKDVIECLKGTHESL